MKILLKIIILLIFCFPAVSYSTEMVKEETLSLGKIGYLKFVLPNSWSARVIKRSKDGFPRVSIQPPKTLPGKVTIKIMWQLPGMTYFNSNEMLEQFMLTTGQKLLVKAEEKTVKLLKFPGKYGSGYYYILTDKAPAPGEFRVVLEGAVRIKKLVVLFSVLAKTMQKELFNTTRKIFANADYLPAVKITNGNK